MTTLTAVFKLARVSNLPTVWSNVLAASVVAGGAAERDLALVLVAMSAMYAGGMVLNDAFDRGIDARERPQRPIPSGAILPSTAWTLGLLLLVTGFVVLSTFGTKSAASAAALASAIVLYDAWHKGNPLSPLIMGACRALVYMTTAYAVSGALSPGAAIAAFALLLYIAGVTHAAKGAAVRDLASSWPMILLSAPVIAALFSGDAMLVSVPFALATLAAIGWAVARLRTRKPHDREVAVGVLIATIALADATVAAAHSSFAIALICAALFVMTLLAQRVIPAT